jgi:hypothetical protein
VSNGSIGLKEKLMSTTWPGLATGQLRELARAFCTATLAATCSEELPQDAWLDARLREVGCPESQLETYRTRIMSLPLQGVVDGGC